MRLPARLSDEDGFAGGWEVLPFGFLVMVVGTLLLVNAWSVVDSKLAVSAAAREAARTFVESSGPEDVAWGDAERAAEDALAGHGRDPSRLRLRSDGGAVLERCRPVTVVASYDVPTVRVPWIGAFGGGVVTVEARHEEIVDPYRDGLPAAEDAPCG